MIKALAAGMVLLLISLCIGIYEGSARVLMTSSAAVSAALILLAIILSGAAVSGDSGRANYASETVKDRQLRFKWAQNFILAAVPCLFVTMIIYFSRQ